MSPEKFAFLKIITANRTYQNISKMGLGKDNDLDMNSGAAPDKQQRLAIIFTFATRRFKSLYIRWHVLRVLDSI